MDLRRARDSDVRRIEAFQRRAYAANRAVLGAEPLPLLASYIEILRDYEVWLAESENELRGILILAVQTQELLVWSVAVEPLLQGRGIGTELLSFAEERARSAGCSLIRLYTASQLGKNIELYQRLGFAAERYEQLPDRTLVHMVKKVC